MIEDLRTALTLHLDGLALRAGGRASGRLLCHDLDVTVRAGERWVVLGPNGAGKSTLLVALAGLLEPNAGTIRLDGRALPGWAGEALARQRAWCPQFWLDPFPVSAWETVACALLATHPELDGDTVQARARDWLQRFDAGPLADTDVRSLSGGERQRVALATAFAQGAPLLLLDEPTAHLDWSHQALLQELLHEWSVHQGTAIVVAHDLNLAWSLATHALLLDGQGGACWGRREDILQADALSAAFGIRVSAQDENGRRWFRVELEKCQ